MKKFFKKQTSYNIGIYFICLFYIRVMTGPGYSATVLLPAESQSTGQTSAAALSDYLDSNSLEKLNCRPFLPPKMVQNFYKKRSYESVWVNNQGLTPTGQQALVTFQKVETEGLNPQDYKNIIAELSANQLNSLTDETQARLEVRTTQFMLLYLAQLYGERVDPEQVSKLIHLKAVQLDPSALLEKTLMEDPSGQKLAALSIEHPEYQQLKEILADYRTKQTLGDWPRLSLPAPLSLHRGIKNSAVIVLRKQLWAQGDLAVLSEDDHFDEELEAAVKQFQERHGLETDGKIGPDTLDALNVSRQERLRQIIISMERWRWIPAHQGERYVIVNIAGYTLQAMDQGLEAFTMPVIIGREFRQTPLFVSAIDYVRFNPTWYVPHSIAIKDKLPLLRKDPGYFKKKGYHIYEASGQEVDADAINWQSITPSSFTYKITQNAGPDNALGRIFFHVNTPFDVFLHGTPDPALFLKTKRSFSSGCIRLADPEKFARFVLNDDIHWTKDAVHEVVESNQKQDVKPPQPLKVYITYQTVWQDNQGKVHFAADFYHQDQLLYQALGL